MRGRAFCAVIVFVVGTLTLFSQNTSTSVPRLVRFGGTITNADGSPRTGVVGVIFSLYSEQQGGTALWTELQNVTLDANGQYTVMLGSQHSDGVPAELFTTNEARWLGIQVEAEPEQPRVLLVSVPYALKAGDAETLSGKPLSAFLLNPNVDTTASGSASTASGKSTTPAASTAGVQTYSVNTSTSGGTANYVAKWIDAQTLGNSLVFDSGSAVGVGTSTPNAMLDVLSNVGAAIRIGRASGAIITYQVDPDSADTGATQFVTNSAGNAYEPFGFDARTFRFRAQGLDQNVLFVDAAGNMGIGTQTPAAALHVVGANAGVATFARRNGAKFTFQLDTDTAATGTTFFTTNSAGNTYVPLTFDGASVKVRSNGSDANVIFLDPNGNVGIGTGSPTGKLTVAGSVQSTSGGFIFPDNTTMTSAAQVPALNAANTFTGNQVINGNLTLNGSIIIGNKQLVLGGFTSPTGGGVQAAENGATTTGPTGFGFNILDNSGNQAITVDTTGGYGTAILHAVQNASAAGCGQYCYYVTQPAALRGDATNTPPSGNAAFGVVGTSPSIGVYGNSTGGIGVLAQTTSTTSQAPAMAAFATATTGSTATGLYATTAGDGGSSSYSVAGLFNASSGSGSTYGVYSTANSPTGQAGYFHNVATTGPTSALFAQTDSNNGTAGTFSANATSGFTYGVYGITYSPSAVSGLFNSGASTGNPYALWSRVHSTNAAAGVFDVPLSAGSGYILNGRQCDYGGTGFCTSLFRVLGDGTTYIGFPGTPGVSALLQVYGQTAVGTPSANADLYVYGAVRANSYPALSSRRFKTNIHTLTGALSKVEHLRGVSYDLKATGQHQIGVIAEEVGEVVPEVVAYEANGKDASGVDYSRLTALLIEAIKEQQKKIDALETELKTLKSRVDDQKQPALASMK